MKIIFWSRLPIARDLAISRLRALSGVELTVQATLADCIACLSDQEGMVLYNCQANEAAELMAAITSRAARLRWMHFLSAGKEGFDGVFIPGHIQVTQTAGASAPCVAEHAMALLLALTRRIPAFLGQQAHRVWDRTRVGALTSLEGKTLAIVGYGHIGREVARRARGFGMHLIALSRSLGGADEVDEVLPLSALLDVLPRCDVVLLSIALTPQTRHLMDAAALRRCNVNALMINVSRGAVFDQEALCAALSEGRIAGAALDVTDPEPPSPTDPIWRCPNLLLSPHVAAAGSPDTDQRIIEGMVATLQRIRGLTATSSPP